MGNKKMIVSIMLLITIVGMGVGWIQLNHSSIKIGQYHNYQRIEDYTPEFGISEDDLKSIEPEDYLIIFDKTDVLSLNIKNNIARVLEYAKKPYEVKDVSEYNGLRKEFEAVIICTEVLGDIKGIEEIIYYGKQGGDIMLAIRPVQDDVYNTYSKAFGILSDKGFKEESGIKLDTNMLMGIDTFEMHGPSIINASLDVEVSEDATVHATTPSGIPLIWEKEFGKGELVLVNGTFFDDISSRGVIINTIALMEDTFIYPIVNAGVMFIDDFPAPVADIKMGKYYPQLDLTLNQFYKEVWWPDVVRVGNKYGVKYTGLFIQSYGDSVKPPFVTPNDIARESFYYFVPELLNQGGEVGYHGFNHQPYTYSQEEADMEDYKAWESKEDAKESWRAFDEYIDGMCENYDFRNYVPPSNMLSAEAREQFPEIAPNVKMISSLHNVAGQLGVYEQEFEVADDGIIEFPRISSGYMRGDYGWWDVYNGITMYGIFSHFIHPDDILNDERREGGEDWPEVLEWYEETLENSLGKYPWIKPMTATQAGEQLKKFEQAEVYFEEQDGVINGYINNFRKDMYFIVRTNSEIASSVNCNYEKIDNNTYWVYTTRPNFSLTMKGGE